MVNVIDIDVSENALRHRGRVLDILLTDRTRSTKNKTYNIIWATDSYQKYGKEYAPNKQIRLEQITGINGKLIQPRAAKSREEQITRTKEKGEVFTPLKVVKRMNTAILQSLRLPKNHTWQDFVKTKWLEITCGEGPFITTRYNPTANTRAIIKPENRVGFLDLKLQSVNANTQSREEWLQYAEIALKSSYGYEWQGDNLLIARENILLTLNDFYSDFCARKLRLKSKQSLSTQQLEHFAEIISWNFFQMDGIRYVIPMSCKHETHVIPGELTLFGETPDRVEKYECEGCKYNRPDRHNGKYVRIMDWDTGKAIRFVDLVLSNKTNA